MKPIALGLSAVAFLATTSCAGMIEKQTKENASRQLGCPADQITITRATEPNQPGKAEGCGKEDWAIAHCVTATGSGGTASSCNVLWFSQAVNQASFTTGCDKEKIQTQWMAPNLAVDACGQRMTFAATLSGWLLNTTSAPPKS
jgi:hypothetical protein